MGRHRSVHYLVSDKTDSGLTECHLLSNRTDTAKTAFGGKSRTPPKRRGSRMFRSSAAGDPRPRAGVLVGYQCFELPSALHAGVNYNTGRGEELLVAVQNIVEPCKVRGRRCALPKGPRESELTTERHLDPSGSSTSPHCCR